MGLRTGFKKVAQSGDTVDGRVIKPEWLLDAAATYSTDIYTASIFPDHDLSGQSYGTVIALKAETDKDGVVSLFADMSPNVFWQSDMRYGQNLFTSIHILQNFAKTGKFYLYSLAATDNPASLGVEKLEFSAKNTDSFYSSAFNTSLAEQDTAEPTQEEVASFFSRFFKSSKQQGTQDMADETTLKDLAERFSTVETQVKELKQEKSPEKSADNTEGFAALQQENVELKTKVTGLEKTNAEYEAKFSALEADMGKFKAELADALKEDPSRSTKDNKEFGANDTSKAIRAAV